MKLPIFLQALVSGCMLTGIVRSFKYYTPLRLVNIFLKLCVCVFCSHCAMVNVITLTELLMQAT
jgi:hypothetical protein